MSFRDHQCFEGSTSRSVLKITNPAGDRTAEAANGTACHTTSWAALESSGYATANGAGNKSIKGVIHKVSDVVPGLSQERCFRPDTLSGSSARRVGV
jgi:hypothetical protein